MSDCRIGRYPGKSVRPATLQAHTQVREPCGSTCGFIGLDQTQESFPHGFRKHGEFGAALLLIQNVKGLAEGRITAADLLQQSCGLCGLAAQAEYRSSGYVRVMDVTCDEATEIVGVLSRSSASTFVQQEFDAVDILK